VSISQATAAVVRELSRNGIFLVLRRCAENVRNRGFNTLLNRNLTEGSVQYVKTTWLTLRLLNAEIGANWEERTGQPETHNLTRIRKNLHA
jgi:hypothetical protein